MPEHASRSTAALYDQFEDEQPVADWGGDELFTRMPRPRAVDDAPAPRFRPYLAASGSEPPAPGPTAPAPERSLSLVQPPEEPQGTAATAEQAMLERAERLGLSGAEPVHRWDGSGTMIEPQPGPRETKVITGHPGGAPRPLPTVRAERHRPARTAAEWIGPRPERIVAWAFALGLILILIAISTADAATL
jgi:hypothetical protein